jgi:hypothetical protein
MASRFRVHPGIGIARVGNARRPLEGSSVEGFFIGPETPGVPGNWDFGSRSFRRFKDQAGAVKRQAARFRIWEYAERDGRMTPRQEVTLDDRQVAGITWKVNVANTKASFYTFREDGGAADTFDGGHPRRNADVPAEQRRRRLEIRPGEKSIAGRHAAPVELNDPDTLAPIKTLGQLRTDETGRLVFLGGSGSAGVPESGEMPYAYNNDGWFDDVCDGSVGATIELRDSGGAVEADAAWVIVAPPDFAPGISSVVTLYDLMADFAVRLLKPPAGNGIYTEYEPGRGLARLAALAAAWDPERGLRPGYRPSYTRDILPLLSRAVSMRWTHDAGYSFHEWLKAGYEKSFGDLPGRRDVRERVFSWLRDPHEKAVRPWLMPRVFADDYGLKPRQGSRHLSLTRTQYALMSSRRSSTSSST